MAKLYHEVLDNGLNIYLYQDKNRNSVYVRYIIKYGGENNDFIYRNKKYSVNYGIAHFLEHLLLEKSKYGNLMLLLGDEQMLANGTTNLNTTAYYFHAITDYEAATQKLLLGIDNPVFNEVDVEEVKSAIYEEIRMRKDDPDRIITKVSHKNLFYNLNYIDNLGEDSNIDNISYKELMKCYEAFYNNQNKILIIGGNIEKDKIMNLLRDIYKDEKYKPSYLELPQCNEPNMVKNEYEKVCMPIGNKLVSISFKINISEFSESMMKIEYYFSLYIDIKTRPTSKLYNNLMNQNIIIGQLQTYYYFIDKFIIIRIKGYVNDESNFIQQILKEFGKWNNYDRQDFELYKKRLKAYQIDLFDNLGGKVNRVASNIIDYNHISIDNIDVVNNLSESELESIISNLNFSNYTITVIDKIKS